MITSVRVGVATEILKPRMRLLARHRVCRVSLENVSVVDGHLTGLLVEARAKTGLVFR